MFLKLQAICGWQEVDFLVKDDVFSIYMMGCYTLEFWCDACVSAEIGWIVF